jgi:hypothetical protein
MKVEIGIEPREFLSWEYLFNIFGIVSLQCRKTDRRGAISHRKGGGGPKPYTTARKFWYSLYNTPFTIFIMANISGNSTEPSVQNLARRIVVPSSGGSPMLMQRAGSRQTYSTLN